jgi:hypothetical protein
MQRLKLNIKGLSSIEVLAATVIMGISGLAIAGFSGTVHKHLRDVNSKTTVADVRMSIIQSTVYARSWALNITKAGTSDAGSSPVNTEMTCLKDGTPCAEGVYNLTLFSPDGTVLVDAQNPSQGFTAQGTQCFTYTNEQDGNCVFRFELQWRPVCPPAQTSCVNPQVRLTGQLKVKEAHARAVNIQVSTMALDIFAAKPDFSSASAPPATPPAATPPGGVVYYTNSTLYSSNNTVTNDLAATVANPSTKTFSLPTTSSTVGGTLSLAGSRVTYTPPTGFYGHDSFNYVVQDSYGTGTLMTAKMEVMTPYTWTGQGGNSDTNNKINWCGEVVSGACDHVTFYGATFLGPETKVVMDGTCQANCDATFNQASINITSLETLPGYIGTVTVSSSGFHVNNIGTGTTFVAANIIANSPDTKADLDLRGGSFICTSTGVMVVYGSINVMSSVRSVQFCPTVIVYTGKNPNSSHGGTGGIPADGTYTGINITATVSQLPTWNNPGNTITLQPVLNSKPEVYIDPTLPLDNVKLGNCLSSSTCQVFVSSPVPTGSTSALNNGNIVDGVGDDNCIGFFSQTSVLFSKVTNDIDESGGTGVYISDAAREVVRFKNWGAKNIFFKSALGVSDISGTAVKTMVINTLQIDTLFNTGANTICIKASSIKSIKGQATGGMFISADRIDEITNVAGEFYVLGATIGKVDGGAGKLCLYNGAKVLDISNFAGTVSSSCSISFPSN